MQDTDSAGQAKPAFWKHAETLRPLLAPGYHFTSTLAPDELKLCKALHLKTVSTFSPLDLDAIPSLSLYRAALAYELQNFVNRHGQWTAKPQYQVDLKSCSEFIEKRIAELESKALLALLREAAQRAATAAALPQATPNPEPTGERPTAAKDAAKTSKRKDTTIYPRALEIIRDEFQNGDNRQKIIARIDELPRGERPESGGAIERYVDDWRKKISEGNGDVTET